jgi:hypothetical protein
MSVQARTVGELMPDPDLMRPPESLSPWLIWEGRLSLLVGREKFGKSTLATYDAVIAAGKGTVLWITAEESVGDVVRRFAACSGEEVYVLDQWPQSWEEVEQVINKLKPVAVYVDSLSSFFSAVEGSLPDHSQGEEWQRLVLRFKRWGCGVCLLAHAKKDGSEYRGSTGIGAAVDLIRKMDPVPDAPNARRLTTVGRIAVPSVTVRWDGTHYTTVESVNEAVATDSTTEARVQQWFADCPDQWISGSKLAGLLGKRKEEVLAVLKAMDGLEKDKKRGWHAAP